MLSRIWSALQNAIFKFGVTSRRHGFVRAVAGSGKTTTAVEYVKRVFKGHAKRFGWDPQIAIVAFNVGIADELKARQADGEIPPAVKVCTSHSLGNTAVWFHKGCKRGTPRLVENKTRQWLKKAIVPAMPDKEERQKWYRENGGKVKKLIDLARNCLLDTAAEITAKAKELGIDFDADEHIPWVIKGLEYHVQNTDEVDFTDQIWLPTALGLRMKYYQHVIVDEAQDLNPAQWALIKRSIHPQYGRILAVGDQFQSIYGFRGAQLDGVESYVKGAGAEEMPLDVTYRCPTSHVELVNEEFPHIPFKAAPNASQGFIRGYDQDDCFGQEDFFSTVDKGDMVLCRTNAPLIEACFTLIKAGKSAIVKGKDIGKQLVGLISQMEATNNINDLSEKLSTYTTVECKRLLEQELETEAENLRDRVDSIYALMDGLELVTDLVNRIQTIFSDNKTTAADVITLSTVHKAKGLEANNVFILEQQLMPHPCATKAWEQQQEDNCRYVALTRSKDGMYFVAPKPRN